jgi:ATP adenylyltransferase
MKNEVFKNLHSYWRSEFINKKNTKNKTDKIFENLPKMKDKDSYILYRSQYSYIVLNRYPYNAGHLLIIPYRKVQDLEKLNKNEKMDILEMLIFSKKVLRIGIKPDGYNIGINIGISSGSGIPNHFHIHIVPRWNGDTNFMPIMSGTRVLSYSLLEIWKKLKTVINSYKKI